MADRGRGFEMPAGKESHPVVSVSWYDAKEYAELGGDAAVDRGGVGEGGERGTVGPRKQGDKEQGTKAEVSVGRYVRRSEVQHERVGHRHDDAGGQVFAGRR